MTTHWETPWGKGFPKRCLSPQTFASEVGTAVRGRMQCSAMAVAVHCGSGCSALRLRGQNTDTEIATPILDKRKGMNDSLMSHYRPQKISAEPYSLKYKLL